MKKTKMSVRVKCDVRIYLKKEIVVEVPVNAEDPEDYAADAATAEVMSVFGELPSGYEIEGFPMDDWEVFYADANAEDCYKEEP